MSALRLMGLIGFELSPFTCWDADGSDWIRDFAIYLLGCPSAYDLPTMILGQSWWGVDKEGAKCDNASLFGHTSPM